MYPQFVTPYNNKSTIGPGTYFEIKVIGIERNEAFVNEAIKRQQKSFLLVNFLILYFSKNFYIPVEKKQIFNIF